MRRESDTAFVGIRGGGWQHVKRRMDSYPFHRLSKLTHVAVLTGGNDLSKRNANAEHENLAKQRTLEDIGTLVTYIGLRVPSAVILTFDLVPWKSKRSIFNCRARSMALNVRKASSMHMHINYIKSFTTIDIRAHKRNQSNECYPIVAKFFDNSDGTYMNR